MNIKIGGLEYKLKFVTDLRHKEDNTKLNGQINWDKCIIEVDGDISLQKQNQVIIHEAFHGILDDYCIEDIENVVRRIGHGIYKLIVDNSEFIKGMIKHDKKLKQAED